MLSKQTFPVKKNKSWISPDNLPLRNFMLNPQRWQNLSSLIKAKGRTWLLKSLITTNKIHLCAWISFLDRLRSYSEVWCSPFRLYWSPCVSLSVLNQIWRSADQPHISLSWQIRCFSASQVSRLLSALSGVVFTLEKNTNVELWTM